MRFDSIKFLNNENNLLVFRDDLYPFLGGGNKGRKLDSIAKDIFSQNSNALVTTGGIQSNHCRAVAIFAAQNKMMCTLVLHGSKKEFQKQSGNAKIMKLSGATILFVNDASEISTAMDNAMHTYTSTGFKPYYIHGGGHTLEGGLAYITVIEELEKYHKKNDWIPDYIFHATGTGATQSGIMAGLDKYGFNDTKVIGISVGRKSEHASKVVDHFYNELCRHYEIINSGKETIVLDDYLCGGYGLYTDQLKELSQNSIKDYGFILDTCYTAKAFFGMLDYMEKNNLKNKKVLFWHTGGILNFLSE